MDQHVRLPAPVQPGRGHGLLAGPERGQQKADRGHLRRVCAGARPQQRVLCPQLQLLCPLVLYAGAHPLRHDGLRAGSAGHRPGCPGPGHWLADGGHPGLCRGAGAGHGERELELWRAAEPRPVCGGVCVRAGRAAGVPLYLRALAGAESVCPAAAGSGAGLFLRIQRGAHRHWQVRPVEHRQRPGGGVHQRPQAERRPAGGGLAR